MTRQQLPGFMRESAHRRVVEVGRQPDPLLLFPSGDLIPLPIDIARVLRLDFHLIRCGPGQRAIPKC